jgi:hypothetical protein
VTAPKGCINIHTDVPGGGANGARPRVVRSRRGEGEACVQKRVQSRAYAPPQCPPTRSPPISQPGHKHHSSGSPHPDTLGLGGAKLRAKPPRHGCQPPHSRDTDEDHPCGQLPPSHLQHRAHRHTFLPDILHGGGQGAPNTLGSTPGQVVEAAPLRSLCRSSARDPWVGH